MHPATSACNCSSSIPHAPRRIRLQLLLAGSIPPPSHLQLLLAGSTSLRRQIHIARSICVDITDPSNSPPPPSTEFAASTSDIDGGEIQSRRLHLRWRGEANSPAPPARNGRGSWSLPAKKKATSCSSPPPLCRTGELTCPRSSRSTPPPTTDGIGDLGASCLIPRSSLVFVAAVVCAPTPMA